MHISKRLFFLSFLFASHFAYSVDVPVEFKAAYFYPTNHRFREIYPVGGPIFGLEISCQTWDWLYPWASVSYFTKSGHSIIAGAPSSALSHTTIQFVPLGFGLKYMQQINQTLDLYFGLGGLATYLHLEDDAPYVIQTSAKWGIGGTAKVGALITFCKAFFIDIATDYSYMKINFDSPGGDTLTRHTADISGFSFGGGIGYRFGCR